MTFLTLFRTKKLYHSTENHAEPENSGNMLIPYSQHKIPPQKLMLLTVTYSNESPINKKIILILTCSIYHFACG